jgi:hypothetical protein
MANIFTLNQQSMIGVLESMSNIINFGNYRQLNSLVDRHRHFL